MTRDNNQEAACKAHEEHVRRVRQAAQAKDEVEREFSALEEAANRAAERERATEKQGNFVERRGSACAERPAD